MTRTQSYLPYLEQLEDRTVPANALLVTDPQYAAIVGMVPLSHNSINYFAGLDLLRLCTVYRSDGSLHLTLVTQLDAGHARIDPLQSLDDGQTWFETVEAVTNIGGESAYQTLDEVFAQASTFQHDDVGGFAVPVFSIAAPTQTAQPAAKKAQKPVKHPPVKAMPHTVPLKHSVRR